MSKYKVTWPRVPRVRILFIAIVLSLLTAIAACGEAVTENDSTVPGIVFDKESVELRGGGVNGAQAVEETFLVMNNGQSNVRIGPPRITSITGCESAYTAEQEISLPPGEMARLAVRLVGHDHDGPHEVELSVPSGDPLKPMTKLKVSLELGDGVAAGVTGPRLSVDKELIAIGAVPFDGPLYERFMLRNNGDEPLILDGLPEVRTEDGC